MLGAWFAAVTHHDSASFAVVGMAAVFAGAAHVPIASLMMVTEMTGGYTLLVPAALAVTLSYVVQMRLSAQLPYRSLYLEQVPRRADSPAHHSEHLEIAVRILERQHPEAARAGDHLELLARLRSGLPADLDHGRRLMLGVLRPGSSWVGRGFGGERGRLDDDTQVITIIRGDHMMAPHAQARLEAGDRLILLTTDTALERVRAEVEAW
jgi:CIC family chloride channel protein